MRGYVWCPHRQVPAVADAVARVHGEAHVAAVLDDAQPGVVGPDDLVGVQFKSGFVGHRPVDAVAAVGRAGLVPTTRGGRASSRQSLRRTRTYWLWNLAAPALNTSVERWGASSSAEGAGLPGWRRTTLLLTMSAMLSVYLAGCRFSERPRDFCT